jgi:hypothetical protein
VNIMRDQQQLAEPEQTEAVVMTRRGILGGLAASVPAITVLSGFGPVSSALAAPAAAKRAGSGAGSARNRNDDLVRGAERRYNAPLLTPGTRLVLPAGITAIAVKDYYTRPHLASAKSAWPRVIASDGTTVDASLVPEHGAPTRVAILSGFTEGWYEVVHASGRADRVRWDAREFPLLWLYGEFGATRDAPFHSRFYTLALQPFSRNPYSRKPLEV